MADQRTAQRRNRYTFIVNWPAGIDPPMGCPASYQVWYPTQESCDLAQQGYEMHDAIITRPGGIHA